MKSKDVGRRIAEARKLQHFSTYPELAAVLKTHKETVRLWEAGKVIPPYTEVEKLARLLKVDEEWILFGIRRGEQLAEERPFLTYCSQQEMLLLTAFLQASKEGKAAIMNTAKSLSTQFPAAEAEVHLLHSKG